MFEENKEFINEVAPGCKWVTAPTWCATSAEETTEFAISDTEVFPVTNTDVSYPADMFKSLMDIINYYNSISDDEKQAVVDSFNKMSEESSIDVIKNSDADYIISDNEVKIAIIRPEEVTNGDYGFIMHFPEENVPDIIIDRKVAKEFALME